MVREIVVHEVSFWGEVADLSPSMRMINSHIISTLNLLSYH